MNENPKLFISYSWSSQEHEDWVLNLATELRESGVDVIFDKWDLKDGHDVIAFMEKIGTDPEIGKVAIICDRVYAEKADNRAGGVGTETQIISPEVYAKQDQDKFVPVLRERAENGKAYLPTYLKSRKYIDFSDDDLYSTQFDLLLRWIFGKPLYIKPELGKIPSFLISSEDIPLGTSTKFKRALEAIRHNKDYAKGATVDYFNTLAENLQNFKISQYEGAYDDILIDNIEKFMPYRNETIEIFIALAQYRDTPETHMQIHRFFENLLPLIKKHERDIHYDNLRFIVHELFLYAIACLLKYECFDAVANLLRNQYYFEGTDNYERDALVEFNTFRPYLKSLENRNSRLKLNRLSLHADLLEQRSSTSMLSFKKIMQADFVLYIADCLNSMRNDADLTWWPVSLVYVERSGVFEIFARAISKDYFNKMKKIFAINTKGDLVPLLNAFAEGKLRQPQWGFVTVNSAALMDVYNLDTK